MLGGSYFVGRIFCIKASRTENFEITVMNRGRLPIRRPHVTEYVYDRNDSLSIEEMFLPQLAGKHFDAFIDMCAYEPGQIKAALEHFGDKIGQYIYVSTASVYSTEDLSIRHESDPVMDEPKIHDQNSDYVWKKLLLERECVEECTKRGIPYTILRPAVIFGPFNYSPRESFYIEKIAKHQKVPVLKDATAKFSMVYALDINEAFQLICGDERAYNKVFNLAAPEEVTHEMFYDSLERFNGAPYDRDEYTCDEAAKMGIPVTFPTKYDELYSSELFCKTFDFSFTPYDEAMKKTFDIFMDAYLPR